MNVSGFNHLTLCINNLEQSLAFYTQVLGMKLIHIGNTDAYLEWGTAWICLLEKPQHVQHDETVGMDHVAFTIAETDFDHAINILMKHRVPIVRHPTKRGGGLSVQFLDPDGIVLELTTDSLSKRMENWQ